MDLSPVGHRVLIEIPQKPNTTKSGIILSSKNVDIENMGMDIAIVVAVGPDAYKDSTPWVKPGDVVWHVKYAGVTHKIDGVMYRVVNDEDFYLIATNPETYPDFVKDYLKAKEEKAVSEYTKTTSLTGNDVAKHNEELQKTVTSKPADGVNAPFVISKTDYFK